MAAVSLGTLPGATGGGYLSEAAAVSADGLTVVGSGVNATPTGLGVAWTLADGITAPLAIIDAGTPSGNAFAVSGSGSMIAGNANNAGLIEPVLWDDVGGVTGLGFLATKVWGSAYGISAGGTVVAGTCGANPAAGRLAFRWTLAGGMVSLGTLAGDTESQGNAISGDGLTIVGTSIGTDYHAFAWTAAGGMVDLGNLAGATTNQAQGVSADGSVIVGSSGFAGFVWTADGMVDVGFLPGGNHCNLSAVSADGLTAVGYANATDGNFRAVVWTAAGGLVDLGFLATGDDSLASGVSADGKVVVGTANSTAGGDHYAVIWSLSTTPTYIAPPIVSLDWSDDRGHSFSNPVSQSMGRTGEYLVSLQWQRLGLARDRVFRISWSSPTRTVLQGAWVDAHPADS